MKTTRKTIPNNTEKEFIVLSWNELRTMMFNLADYHKKSTSTYKLTGIIDGIIHQKLNEIGIKLTKKQLLKTK